MQFENQIAIVTGAARGIGRAIALELASRGADIALLDYGSSEEAANTVAEIESLGRRACFVACDVSDFDGAKSAVKTIRETLGEPDILINNAGITRDKLLPLMRRDDFDAVIDVNLRGSFNMIKHTAPVFLSRRRGCIVNISSVSGLMGNPGQINYSASKAGVIGLTKSVAKELASRHVRCNAIAPGFIETAMTAELSERNPLIDHIPLGRMGKPEEVARLAAFLCSDDAAYITGEVIRIDGGLAM
ncbi:MAG: 3-oxoacyl-[Clostridia bacterium]|nr:3-oxoacyl-[acyl-carrier-protein] reductase [Clostridia bacterium]